MRSVVRVHLSPFSFALFWTEENDTAKLCGGVAQLGEHLLCKQGVRSSILLIYTIGIRLSNELKPQFFYGRIAQVVRAHA